MSDLQTERSHDKALGIDTRSGYEILRILHDSQVAAASVVGAAIDQIERGAEAMATTIRSGGKLVYAAAGSSGLMGLADGLELPPTFGIATSQVSVLRAGGLEDMATPKGQAEDNADSARHDARNIGESDCVICLAASGNTTYPVTIMELAKSRGATTIGIANNPDTALTKGADIAICIATPPEVIAGSTRLGAGTAQKITLNMMSTLMGVKLGHVMDGLMVNVVSNNAKLFARSENIVMSITGCTRETARKCLDMADGAVKQAVLIVSGVKNATEAKYCLDETSQNLRSAIERIKHA